MSPPSRRQLATWAPGHHSRRSACSRWRPSFSCPDRSSALPVADCSVRYGGRPMLFSAPPSVRRWRSWLRYLASDWVVATAGGRLKQLAEGVEAEGRRFIAFVRLVALFPFNLVNYGLGLTRVRLLDYSLASPSPWHPARSPTPASAVPAA